MQKMKGQRVQRRLNRSLCASRPTGCLGLVLVIIALYELCRIYLLARDMLAGRCCKPSAQPEQHASAASEQMRPQPSQHSAHSRRHKLFDERHAPDERMHSVQDLQYGRHQLMVAADGPPVPGRAQPYSLSQIPA